jgi:hypothetical protein
MESSLLLLLLNKAHSGLEDYIVAKIKEALLGHETSLDDISKLVNGLQISIDALPSEVRNSMTQQKFMEIISQANHNIEEENVKELLDFLNDGKKDSYWGMANTLAINMTSVSATEMEIHMNTPNSLNFGNPASFMNTAKAKALGKIIGINEYISTIAGHVITLSAAVVSLQHVATRALKKISEVKSTNEFYGKCQERINNTTTKKYLPFSANMAKKGLAAILSPAIVQAPRAVIGLSLTTVLEKACKDGSPWLAIKSYRFKDNDRCYLQCSSADVNPWTSDSSKKNWYIQFSDNSLNKINIFNQPDGYRKYLTIGLPNQNYPDPEKISGDYGVRIVGYGSSWNWYVTSKKSETVHIFECDPESSVLKRFLSTKWSIRNYILPGYSKSDEDSLWILEVNGF